MAELLLKLFTCIGHSLLNKRQDVQHDQDKHFTRNNNFIREPLKDDVASLDTTVHKNKGLRNVATTFKKTNFDSKMNNPQSTKIQKVKTNKRNEVLQDDSNDHYAAIKRGQFDEKTIAGILKDWNKMYEKQNINHHSSLSSEMHDLDEKLANVVKNEEEKTTNNYIGDGSKIELKNDKNKKDDEKNKNEKQEENKKEFSKEQNQNKKNEKEESKTQSVKVHNAPEENDVTKESDKKKIEQLDLDNPEEEREKEAEEMKKKKAEEEKNVPHLEPDKPTGWQKVILASDSKSMFSKEKQSEDNDQIAKNEKKQSKLYNEEVEEEKQQVLKDNKKQSTKQKGKEKKVNEKYLKVDASALEDEKKTSNEKEKSRKNQKIKDLMSEKEKKGKHQKSGNLHKNVNNQEESDRDIESSSRIVLKQLKQLQSLAQSTDPDPKKIDISALHPATLRILKKLDETQQHEKELNDTGLANKMKQYLKKHTDEKNDGKIFLP